MSIGLNKLLQTKKISSTEKTLQQYGYGIPDMPKKTTLSKIFDVLRTGEYAVGGLLAGKGARKGIKQKISPSTVLGAKSFVGKIALDILLDPTTYLTFGTGGTIKLALKSGNKVALSKVGSKFLTKTTKKILLYFRE